MSNYGRVKSGAAKVTLVWIALKYAEKPIEQTVRRVNPMGAAIRTMKREFWSGVSRFIHRDGIRRVSRLPVSSGVHRVKDAGAAAALREVRGSATTIGATSTT